MQTWAKRGLQTALVTGGLLMLGTGIASADEDVNPDKPASPLDGSLTVPVHIDNNALGTPLGQKNLPGINQDFRVSPSDVLGSVPMADRALPVASTVAQAQQAAAPVVDQAQTAAAPVADTLAPVADKAPVLDRVAPLDTASGLNGNTVNADLVVPIDISGNAIAVLGQAEVENESDQSVDNSGDDVTTDGSGGFLAGNAVDLDYALPIQIAGNAIAAVGSAESTNSSTQDVATGGDLVTNGDNGLLSGTAAALHGATPVQVTGNAVAGGGWAATANEAETSADSGGSVLTSGDGGAAAGTAGAVPIAVPVELNGNGVAGLGGADATSDTMASADAGDTRTGLYNVPTYVQSSGENALLSGTVAQPAASGPVNVCGNAVAGVGEADAVTDCATEAVAGGTNRSSGAESAGSGSIAHAPVALPVEAFGNAVAGVGDAETLTENTVDAEAGGDSYTRGHDSVLGGTTAVPSVASAVDVFANPIAGAGDADTEVDNDVESEAGGHTGTTGDDSAGGGNMGTVPVTLPGEVFGNPVAAVGGAESVVTETKTVSSGGGSNTTDPHGVGAANLVTVPVASAVQGFGNGAGLVAFTDAEATNDAEATAGGNAQASGEGGLLSGNIAQGAAAVPFQAFGDGASVLANGEQEALNEIELTSGGDATTDGTDGAGSGNVVNVPLAGAGQVFGDSVAGLGFNETYAESETESTAGGDTETSGESGLLAGNVASPQGLAIAQAFGDAVSAVGGDALALSASETESTSGGDIDTNGDDGVLSGNLADVPAAAVVQPFGDAVAVIASRSFGSGVSETAGQVGGESTTSGEFGSLSGIDGTLPLGANLPIYDVPVEILAQAMTDSANWSEILVGEGTSQLDFPVSGGIAPTELPSLLPMQRSMPTDDFTGAFTGVLDGFATGMSGLPGQDMITDVAGNTGTLTDAPGEFHILPAPYPMGRDLPVAGALPLGGLPVGGLPVNGLPTDQVTGLLGGLPVAGVLPTGGLPVVGGLAGGLPVSRDLPLPTGDLLGGLPIVGGLLGGGLGGFGGFDRDLPAFPSVFGDLADVPAVPALGDVTDVTELAAVPAVPAVPAVSDLADVTTVIPAVPAVPAAGDLTDVTSVIPAVPAVPSVPVVGDFADVPVVQSPSLGTLPVAVPEVSGIQAPGISNGTPAIDDSSLDATRAALANLFAQHPIG